MCKTGKMVYSKTHYTTSELSSMYPSQVAAAYVSVRIDGSHKVSSQMFAYVNDSTITAIQPKTSIVRFVMKYLQSSIMTKQGAGLISPSASSFLQLNEVSIIDCGQKISHELNFPCLVWIAGFPTVGYRYLISRPCSLFLFPFLLYLWIAVEVFRLWWRAPTLMWYRSPWWEPRWMATARSYRSVGHRSAT